MITHGRYHTIIHAGKYEVIDDDQSWNSPDYVLARFADHEEANAYRDRLEAQHVSQSTAQQEQTR